MSLPLLFQCLQALTAFLALRFGGAPEKRVAVMQVLAAAATILSYHRPEIRFYHFESAVFAIDLALLAGLYWVALRANRFWPIAMTALQLSSILSHLARLMEAEMAPWTYALLLNAWAYPMVFLLLVAVIRHRLRIRRLGVDEDWSWPS